MSFVRPFFGYRDQILIFINDPNPGVKKTVHAINEIMKLPEGDMPVVISVDHASDLVGLVGQFMPLAVYELTPNKRRRTGSNTYQHQNDQN